MTAHRRVQAEITLTGGRHYEAAYCEIDDRGWVHASARRYVVTGSRADQRRSYPTTGWTRMSWPKREVREIRWLEHEDPA